MALGGVGFSRRKGARFDVCDGSVVAQRLKGSENGERKEDSENGRFHSQRKNSECGRSQGEEGGQGNELTHGPHERENSEHTATLHRFRIQSHCRTAPQSVQAAHANLVAVLPLDWACQGDQKLALKFGLSASLEV